MPDADPPPKQKPEGAILNDAQIAFLQRAVQVMTAVLVVGVAVVIGRIVYLSRAGGAQASSSPNAVAAALRPEMSIALPKGADIKGISLAGDRLAVHTTTPAAEETITVFDLGSGRVASRITISRSP